MKIAIALLLSLSISLFGKDIVVFENEFNLFKSEKPFTQIVVGNKDLLTVTLMSEGLKSNQNLRLFGKKSGNTSLLIHYSDGTIENYQVYVNQNLGFIQKMINIIAPDMTLYRVGDGSVVLGGTFSNPHQKKRVYDLLISAGIDANRTMDLSKTKNVEKMVRTKLYLVAIDNDRAEELGGAVGLNYFAEKGKIALNTNAKTYATFSGFLLDQTGAFANTGNSLLANLNFLQSKGVAKILDDTALLSTEDQNSSFHVGGEVYIPVGLTYNTSNFPTINLEEKEYGLRLTIRPKFLEKDGFMGIVVNIANSEFDTDPSHKVQLGQDIYVPAFLAKNISTDVVAKNGEVIALGGRLHTEMIDQEEKIPFLGDIPILGNLFKRTVKSSRANDLLFFLVPEIIDSNKDIDDRNFYKDFKNDSKILHNEIVDNNTSKTEENTVAIESKVIYEEKNTIVTSSTIETKIIPSSPVVMTRGEKPSKYAKVTSKYLYIRIAPKDGEPVRTWKEGHRFGVGESQTIEDITWIKITEDCKIDQCTKVEEPMWISKNHIKFEKE
jgi:pilus assembly protein CpaC